MVRSKAGESRADVSRSPSPGVQEDKTDEWFGAHKGDSHPGFTPDLKSFPVHRLWALSAPVFCFPPHSRMVMEELLIKTDASCEQKCYYSSV